MVTSAFQVFIRFQQLAFPYDKAVGFAAAVLIRYVFIKLIGEAHHTGNCSNPYHSYKLKRSNEDLASGKVCEVPEEV
ncbi:unnamed protein product [Gongylonema pulchrum]|uniref:Transporter n=1 Tax=Gongylonema pulchrum TaxID=637853 RepID=A0A183CVJ7_9BILA|nr:unnamed protein product [Gongylonema pulchrum]